MDGEPKKTDFVRLVENGVARAIAELVVRRIEAARAAAAAECDRDHAEAGR